MDERRGTLIFLVVVFICVSFILYKNTVTIRDLRSELQQEREFSTKIANDFYDSCQEILQRAQNIESNISDLETEKNACLSQLPELQARAQAGEPPQNRIPLERVFVGENQVVIDVHDVVPGITASSESMRPFLGNDTIVLEIVPNAPGDIAVGDVIIYEFEDHRIIHRVIKIGVDDEGWYAILKGDNNPYPDAQPVRFDQVKGVVVGIIY